MRTFSFTITIKDHSVCSEEMANAIFEAGADDSGVGSSDGKVFVHFDRQADSLDTAIRTAIEDVTKAGYQISRIEMDEVEMASLLAS